MKQARQNPEAVIRLRDLRFTWPGRTRPVLDLEDFQVPAGEHLFVMGPSGSGKTTLLGILAGILTPQQGTVSVLGQTLSHLRGSRRDKFRADHIGFIFQMFNLIPYLSLVDNVILPCRFSTIRTQRALAQSGTLQAEALRLLAYLNLEEQSLLEKPTVELSVGQQQRVAAARALIGGPEILIADEPTSSLDTDHREAFIKLLFAECARSATSLIFVSHDTSLASLFHRTLKLDQLNRVGAFARS